MAQLTHQFSCRSAGAMLFCSHLSHDRDGNFRCSALNLKTDRRMQGFNLSLTEPQLR